MIELVQATLTDDLRRPPWRGSPDPLAGHCYVASEALYHLGLREQGYRPMFIRHEGSPHWFLARGTEVVDATASQFRTPVPYSQAKGKGFLTREPSRRARILMSRLTTNPTTAKLGS